MKKLFISALLVLNFHAFSQKHELGNVTVEELKEKACPKDTSAVAAVLFNVGKTSFDFSTENGFELKTEIITKIKIYKKEGYEYANQVMKYYIGGGKKEKADVSKAVTYNLINGKIEKSKLGSDGEFDENVNKYWGRKKITMPNVKVGSIIEFKYILVSPYLNNIPEWEFQKDVPVIYSEYTTYIPEYYIYNAHNKGFLMPKVESEDNHKEVSYTSKERSEGVWQVTQTSFSKESFSFMETRKKYVLENIPALKEETFVNNINNYRSALIHEMSGRRMPNKPFENFATDWESVTKDIYENESFGSELKKTGYFEKDLEVLLNGVTSSNERIAIIFNYVKSRMNWDEYHGIYCDAGVKRAYQEKKGNVAEINLMLTAMLRYAGFNANPILVSTRSNGISLYPSKSAFNYVIAGLELENQVVLLDATDKYSSPNILPVRVLNWIGRIVRNNESSAMVDLMPKTNSKDVVNILASINPQGEVSGKIRDQYFDYNAYVFRGQNNLLSKDSSIEKLEKRHAGLEIHDYEVQNGNDLSKPIVENYSFTTNNAVEIIGDKMYFTPLLFFTMNENPFKQEAREYPVDFEYPNQDRYTVSITLPEGFVVETLPQPTSVSLPDGLANFKYNISNNGNQIQLMYTFDLNAAIVSEEYYDAVKNFFKEMVNKQTEKIVLKKV